MTILFECFFVKTPHNSTYSILACPIYIVCDWNVSGELFSHIIPTYKNMIINTKCKTKFEGFGQKSVFLRLYN